MRVLSLLAVLVSLSPFLLSLVLGQTSGPSPVAVVSQSDVAVMNFALTLERLDSTFFTCYLFPLNTTNPYCQYTNATYAFTQQDFANAGYNATVFQAVALIAQEEYIHATLLNSTIMGLGFTPVPACNYVYPNITSVAAYMAQALAFETAGTAAYAGGLFGISNPQMVQVAATIATVEARHAGYLSNLLGVQPFASNGLNPVYNSSQVAAIVAPYYVNPACLALTPLPVVRPYGVTAENATNPAPYIGSQTANASFTYSAQARANDLATLNYALVLENLEAAFYAQANASFTPAQFASAGYSPSVASYLALIASNEAAHVALLTMTIQAYGGTPNPACTFNFSALGFSAFSSIPNYLAYASTLEGVGVQAYDGAANTLTDTFLLQTAGSIALIEARHTAFINSLLYPNNQSQAFPSVVDSTMTPLQVFTAAVSLGLITSCPFVNVSNPTQVAALLPLVATPYPVTQSGIPSVSAGSTGTAATTGSSFTNQSSAAPAVTSAAPTPSYNGSTGAGPSLNGAGMQAGLGQAAVAVIAVALMALLL